MNTVNRLISGALCIFALAQPAMLPAGTPYRPMFDRLPQKASWEVDVTDRLEIVSSSSEARPYSEVMTAAERNARVKGSLLQLRLKLREIANQAKVDDRWPMVLQADESRVIESCSLDGKPVGSFDRTLLGDQSSSGEGALLLNPGSLGGTLMLSVRENPLVYANTIGRLKLRPATTDEVIRIRRVGETVDRVRVENLSKVQIQLEVRALHEDYFGIPLGELRQSITLAGGASETVVIPGQTRVGRLHKTRIWASVDGKSTREYWNWNEPSLDRRGRDDVVRLGNEWEIAFVPGPLADHPAPPADSGVWKKHRVPFEPSGAEYSSHWMWAKQKFTVPSDWKAGKPLGLFLPRDVLLTARVMVDGKLLAEVSNWELPTTLELPQALAPGTEHELLIGVTDYVAGLAPGATPPPAGPMSPTGRGMNAPISTTNDLRMKFDVVAELVSFPRKRVDSLKVRTQVVTGKKLFADIRVKNTTGGADKLTASAEVLLAGEKLLDLGEKSVDVAPGMVAVLNFSKAFEAAPLWSPETPDLLELRTTLKDGSGAVVDVYRARFGFREVGTKDGQYLFNGEKIHLVGGSHIALHGMMWPMIAHPYRLHRHVLGGSERYRGGCLSGVVGLNIADEGGYFVKAAEPNLNAHGADNYSWHLPEIWDRVTRSFDRMIETYANRPSVIMWDVANEISFKGPGEDEKMGALLAHIEASAPGTFATVGGSGPIPKPTTLVNYHGWGDWNDRGDYFFMRPEERPTYLRKAGYFWRKPENDPETNWRLDLRDGGSGRLLYPGTARELRHVGGKPLIFAEGHYYENNLPTALFGHDAYLPLVLPPDAPEWARWTSVHGLQMLATRAITITNVRQAGFQSSMIHVDRGVGRSVLPLASFSWDRKTRVFAGDRFKTRFGVHYDLTRVGKATASYRLMQGERVLGEKVDTREYRPGELALVDLDFAVPLDAAEKPVRIEIRVTPETGGGEFANHVDLHVLAPVKLTLPKGRVLTVFDPRGDVTRALNADGVVFESVAELSKWTPAAGSTLLVGSEGLANLPALELGGLRSKIAEGAQVVVLDHFSLPTFLHARVGSTAGANTNSARMDGDSAVTQGLTSEDFRAWTTRESDQIVSWNPLETPGVGAFRAHVTTGRGAPVLEVAEGKGRVLFVQLNLKDALGVEPAARKVLANVLNWTATPSPFDSKRVLLVSSETPASKTLVTRYGLDAKRVSQPTVADIQSAEVVVVFGEDSAAREALTKVQAALKEKLESGASLLVYGLNADGAAWLNGLTGAAVKVEEFPHRHGWVRGRSTLLAGIGHGDFFPAGAIEDASLSKPALGDKPLTGTRVLSGTGIELLTSPANLGEIRLGKGRVAVSLVRSLETPLPGNLRVLSQLLLNLGARVDPGAVPQTQERWAFHPIDLQKFVNRSSKDNDSPTKPRGWNASGENNDLREFRPGRQVLRGVDYQIATDGADSSGFIALRGAKPKFEALPTEVKGIRVDRKAERLYLLHVSVWGTPGFVYRVYYKEDRAKWIPGKPDPFVDVVVKPHENIEDWVFAGATDRGERFMAGATVAWLGGTTVTRNNASTGAKDVGLFQMVWDNPNPEKTIESIDILSPGTVGTGHPFIFGITAADRDASGTAGPTSRPISMVLPKDIPADRVVGQAQTAAYGAVFLRDGSVGAIYDSAGRTFARVRPSVVVGTRAGPPGAPEERNYVSVQEGQSPKLSQNIETGRQEFVFSGADKAVEWTKTYIVTAGKLRCEVSYTPLADPPEGFLTRWIEPVSFVNGAEASVKVNENPFTVTTAGGPVAFGFDSRHTTWVFSYWMDKHGVHIASPPKDYPPYVRGRTEKFWWELTLP